MAKAIKVKDLIEQLHGVDPELPVNIYVELGAKPCALQKGVEVIEKHNEDNFSTRNWPDVDGDKFVLIF